jgi:hypothetical protein
LLGGRTAAQQGSDRLEKHEKMQTSVSLRPWLALLDDRGGETPDSEGSGIDTSTWAIRETLSGSNSAVVQHDALLGLVRGHGGSDVQIGKNARRSVRLVAWRLMILETSDANEE